MIPCLKPYGNYVDLFVSEKFILELFHPNVISSFVVHDHFQQIQDHLHSIVYETFDEMLGDSARNDVVKIGSKLKNLEDDLQKTRI